MLGSKEFIATCKKIIADYYNEHKDKTDVTGEIGVDDGIMVDFTANEGVVNLMNFSQKDWHCDDCDIDFGTGDIEDSIEIF